ncbi:hypothetical protein BH20CHL1_BH20CHL1_05960 [soil metagenome]
MQQRKQNGCAWPALDEPYQQALTEAVEYVFQRFEPVGLLVSGTIIRGNPGKASDLDITIIHREPWRQRVQKVFNGVPAEIFVNPREQIEQYFEAERKQGRPVTAHMLATGFTIYDPDGVVKSLQVKARNVLAAGPEISPSTLTWRRYATATWLEDAVDIVDSDPELCIAFLFRAVDEAVRYRFWDAGEWQPRHKDLLRSLTELDPQLNELVLAFLNSGVLADCIECARQVLEHSVGETGFFEWESEIEPV